MEMEEIKYQVYCHSIELNGVIKRYIGITHHQDPNKRWLNGRGYRDCPRFYNAIKKYGWNNFTHEIIETGLSQEDAEQMEIQLIQKYNSANRQFGYNIGLGGRLSGKHSEETRQKIKQNHAHLCGEDNVQYKIIAVVQLDFEGNFIQEYKNCHDAEKVNPIFAYHNIISNCKKRTKSCGGFMWMFKEDYEKEIQEKGFIQPYKHNLFRKIAKLDKNHQIIEVFDTIKEAGASVNVRGCLISNALKKNSKAKGYYWQYLENSKTGERD